MLIPHPSFTTPVTDYVSRRLTPGIKHAPDSVISLARFRLDALDGYGDAYEHVDLPKANANSVGMAARSGLFTKLKNLIISLPGLA